MSFEAAVQAYERGDKVEARRLVIPVIRADPSNEEAWTLLIHVAENPTEQTQAVEYTLRLNPQNPTALNLQIGLDAASSSSLPPEPVKQAVGGGKTVRELGTYEMLWDCKFCGAKKLLGKTHRYCPNCGAAQDPAMRYFPSDAEKVAVKDHKYYGADAICPACDTPNSAKAEYCVSCGSPLGEGDHAKKLGEQVRQSGESFSVGAARGSAQTRFEDTMAEIGQTKTDKEESKRARRRKLIIGGVVAAAIAFVVLAIIALLQTRATTVYVTGHSWERSIEVEAYGPQHDSSWCDSMPGDAYSVSRSRKQRSTNKIPDGETCRTRRIDNGDGTYREVEECQTKYRDEPVYDDWCSYTVDRWVYSHTETAQGDSVHDTPTWPAVHLARDEREGDRSEKYNVHLKERDGDKTFTCGFDGETEWRDIGIETHWDIEVTVVTGQAKCGTMKPAE